MKYIYLALALAMLISSAIGAEPRIDTARLNWTQSLPSGEGIIFSGTAPSTTTNALYSDAGTLKFNGTEIGGGSDLLIAADTFINTSGTTITAYDRSGGVISTTETTSTTGIKAMIEAAMVRGGNIILRGSLFDIGTEQINVPTDGTRWVLSGTAPEGDSKTTIKGNGTHVFYYGYTSTYQPTGTLQNLHINGSGVANGLYILPKYCWSKLLDNVWITYANYAIMINDSVGCQMITPHIENSARGIYVYGTSTGSTTLDVQFPYIKEITNIGIRLEGQVQGCSFGPGVVELCGNPAVKLYGTAAGRVSGNSFHNLWFEEDGTNEFIQFDGYQSGAWYGPSGNTFAWNTFHCGSSLNAIRIDDARRNVFMGNTAYGSGSTHFTVLLSADTEYNQFLYGATDGNGHWVISDSGTGNAKTGTAEAE